jgi:T-complex protein 1 subunit beta
MVDEAERSLHDALSVLSQTVKETRVVLGGGCAEMLMSNAVDETARTISGKKALAVESFAKALRQVNQGNGRGVRHGPKVRRCSRPTVSFSFR